jgi:anaerobic selenocysteine-containing dehydrogenase
MESNTALFLICTPIRPISTKTNSADHAATKPGRKQPPDRSEDVLELLAVEQVFDTEELSCRSPQLQELEAEPVMWISAFDARRLKITDGEKASIDTGIGRIMVAVCVSEKTAAGSVILPRHRRLMWQLVWYDVPLFPMYLLIAVWGSTRNEYGAMKLTAVVHLF